MMITFSTTTKSAAPVKEHFVFFAPDADVHSVQQRGNFVIELSNHLDVVAEGNRNWIDIRVVTGNRGLAQSID